MRVGWLGGMNALGAKQNKDGTGFGKQREITCVAKKSMRLGASCRQNNCYVDNWSYICNFVARFV
jgi:hypothetical protein